MNCDLAKTVLQCELIFGWYPKYHVQLINLGGGVRKRNLSLTYPNETVISKRMEAPGTIGWHELPIDRVEDFPTAKES